jgi:hypothetical protein
VFARGDSCQLTGKPLSAHYQPATNFLSAGCQLSVAALSKHVVGAAAGWLETRAGNPPFLFKNTSCRNFRARLIMLACTDQNK